MKSKQRHNSKSSNSTKPLAQSQHESSDSSQCQQQLISQWDIHTNRLNYLQQTITKLQRKINKLQKTFSSGQGEFREQISQKIAQMIQIITNQQEPKGTQQGSIKGRFQKEIESLRQEIKTVVVGMNHTLDDKLSNLQERIDKIQASSSNLNKRDVKNLIEQRVNQIQTKISRQIDSSIIQIYQKMDGYQIKLKDITKKLENNSEFDNKFRLTNSKSSNQKVYPNDRLLTSPESSTTSYKVGNKVISKTPDEKQNMINIFQQRSTNVVDSNGTQNMMHKKKNVQSTVVAESESKSNRVVYLRQKLKEFQNINRKYDIKDKQIDNNTYAKRQLSVTTQFSASKLKSVSKDNLQVPKELVQVSNSIYEPTSNRPSYMSSLQKTHSKLQSSERLTSFQRQQSSAKRHSTTRVDNLSACLSSSKKTIRNQVPIVSQNKQSSRKMQKLKSIRGYLQQTQSEVDDSVLEPNYA